MCVCACVRERERETREADNDGSLGTLGEKRVTRELSKKNVRIKVCIPCQPSHSHKESSTPT